MRKPLARPIKTKPTQASATKSLETEEKQHRSPQAFSAPLSQTPIEDFVDTPDLPDLASKPKRRRNWPMRLAIASGGLLISLGLVLTAERLINDLFARFTWLGWTGTVILAVFALVLTLLAGREIAALGRLRKLDRLRVAAAETLVSDHASDARKITHELQSLYTARPDLARARAEWDETTTSLFDGSDIIKAAEGALMKPLDARAVALTAAASRRVAIVTAISPRALVDLAFVAYESFKLARNIAELYGAKPGLFGSWRLVGAILAHLAVTGGVALGDSVIQQLVGHGLAAKVSARLGEGLVNGLMTVRVGIAAMRVTRPLPFAALKQPVVIDFMSDLAKIGKSADKSARLDK